LGKSLAVQQERRSLRGPDLLIEFRGFAGTGSENNPMDEEPAERPGDINHPGIEQKLPKIVANCRGVRRIWAAKINEENTDHE